MTNKLLIAGELAALLGASLGLVYWLRHRARQESFDEWFESQDPRTHGVRMSEGDTVH